MWLNLLVCSCFSVLQLCLDPSACFETLIQASRLFREQQKGSVLEVVKHQGWRAKMQADSSRYSWKQ